MKELLKNKKSKQVLIIVGVVLVIGLFTSYFYSNRVNVRKILTDKYDSIKCIDKYCKSIYAEEEKNNTIYVKLLNENGNIVGRYDYKKTKKKVKEPFYLSEKYLLMKKQISSKKAEYTINNKNAKEEYKAKGVLSKINDDLVLETKEAKIDYVYNIINYQGKEIITNITEFESYNDGNILYGIKDTHNYIISKSGKILLDGYTVADERDDYLVLKSASKDSYYYFNIAKQKIMNEAFSTYVIKDDDSLQVARKENNTTVIYAITKNGRENKDVNKAYLYNHISDIQKNIDSNKYDIYLESIVDEFTENIFVDNKNNNSFGIYNTTKKSYRKLYDYTSSAFNTEINVIPSLDGKTYFQVSCAKPYCKTSLMYVYAYTTEDSTILFHTEGSDKLASEYHQYNNGYKVLKYSNNSKDEEYKNKYVLYDKKNKEIEKSENYISVIDSFLLLGEEKEKSLLIYNTQKGKMVNTDSTLAEKVSDNYYLFNNKLVNRKGEEVYSAIKNHTLSYSNDFVYSFGNKDVKVYSIKTGKIYTYKLGDKEITKSSDNINLVPFRNIVFVNNESKKYSKLINTKSNKYRKLKDNLIFKIYSNEENNRNYIIVKKSVNGKLKYGLYILD